MHRRIPVALAATATLGAAAFAIAPAIAATAHSAAAKKNRIVIRTSTTFKIGYYVRDNSRFTPLSQKVRSGATVTLINKGAAAGPHTISFVKKSQLPRTRRAINNCGVPKGVCLALAKAHQFNPQTNEVGVPIVDVGKPGVDGPGNSFYIPPTMKHLSFKVSAPKGKTLYFFCVVHPWMQGSIKVR